MNRPILWAAISFASGIAAIDLAPKPMLAVFLGGLLGFGLYVVPHRLPYRDGFLFAVIFFLAGSTWTAIRAPEQREDRLAQHVRTAHPDRLYTLECDVIQAPVYTPDMEYMTVRLKVHGSTDRHDAIPGPGHAVLRWSLPDRAVHPGDRLRVRGRLTPRLGEVNMGTSGAADYYRRHGYHSTLRARGTDVEYRASPTWNLRYWASRLRQWETMIFQHTVPPSAEPLVRAVWLGDRSALDRENNTAFLETGTAHILAVSGVHIGILYLSLQVILRGLLRNRKQRAVVVLCCIFVFALVTGARTPILRAFIMLGLYLWAEFLDREPDAPTALALAALLFLGYNPGLLRDTGFALSFSSLASLFLFAQPIAERLATLPRSLGQNIGATVGVSLLPLPLTAHIFHIVTLVGPVCNLLVIPLLAVLLWLCLLTVSVASVSLPAASLFGHATVPIVWAIESVSTWGAAIPWGHFTVTSPSTLAWLCYATFLLGIYGLIKKHPRFRACLGLSLGGLIATLLFWQPLSRPATLDFLDVGHGDATFIRTPGGTTLLIDGGDCNEYVDQGKRTVVPWLLANGVSRLDYVVATHPDRDHVGGLGAVLETLDVDQVVLWPTPSEDRDAQLLVQQCAAANVPIRRVVAGDRLPARDAEIRILNPPADTTFGGTNDNSVVLYVAWAGLSALFTGDIEKGAESLIEDSVPVVDVLKVPHHGSFTSSSPGFLNAVAPHVAVVSTGRGRNRNPMNPTVERRYTDGNIALYRTDYHGGIRIRRDKNGLRIETSRGQRGYSLAPGEN